MINSDFAGINENNKPSSKVLRPPGGGSSDIFGADMPQTPRTVKNHMQSNIFSCEKSSGVKNNGDQPRRAQKNVDSYTRLFGEPERPITPGKNHMKSSIPFGANTEAAQQLLTNGNGYHSNGKSGSVSSASSSVSSSTENLKMNGVSKTVYRKMTSVDPACPRCPTPVGSESETASSLPLNMDLPCEDKYAASLSARSKQSDKADIGNGDVASQTRRDTGSNSEHPHSLETLSRSNSKREPMLDACADRNVRGPNPRNPITGCGLGEDGVGGIKPKKPKSRRDGNPVTGEGYKPGNDNNGAPTMNGANQVINKNRIPPGGFSSGLW